MATTQTKADALPRWDLTNVYPALGAPEYKAAVEEFKDMIDGLEEYLAKKKVGPGAKSNGAQDPAKLAKIIAEVIDRFNAAGKLGDTIFAFVYSFITTDSYNDEAKRALSEIEQVYVRFQQMDVKVKGWIGANAKSLTKAVKLNKTAKTHAFYLRETAQQSKFLMGGPEEDLAAELSLSGGNAWSKLQGTVTSQLSWPIEQEDGKVEKLPMTAILNLRSNPSEMMRRRGYEAELEAWKSVEETLAACLNGVKGESGTLETRRGREDSVHRSIDQARIDRPTLEAMLAAMQASFPMFRKYFHAKAKRLGKERLPWWDVFAPSGKADRHIPYAEAQQFVLDHFAGFSPELSAFAKRAFDNNWIDVGPRDGKRAGGFCMGVPAVDESRILLNYEGNLDWVFSLAHELGHAFHNDCLVGKTPLQRQTPMTLAETASIMCETVITNAAIENAAGPQEELAILETALISDSQVVVDIYSRYLFEKEVFERRAKSELSAAEFSEIMENAQKATYGDGLDDKYLQKYMWTWKPHYYRPELSFYNYPYAFGLLFGIGLYAIYQQRGAEFVPEYKGLLASTGEGTAADLAARFGIEIRTPKFWEDSLKVIGQRIDRYIAL